MAWSRPRMSELNESGARPAVLLIAPRVPPYGGMGLQADLMQERLEQEGTRVIRVAPNAVLPKGLRFFERLRGVRPLVRLPVFCVRLWRGLTGADVVHI